MSTAVVPNHFCSTGHLFYFGGHGGHKVNFYIPLFPLFSPPFQQFGGLGERCKLPQRGLGWSPSRKRILEHSMATSDRFDMLREIFQRSKQHEIFRFSPRISYSHHNWHNGSYSTGPPGQNGKFYSFRENMCTQIIPMISLGNLPPSARMPTELVFSVLYDFTICQPFLAIEYTHLNIVNLESLSS